MNCAEGIHIVTLQHAHVVTKNGQPTHKACASSTMPCTSLPLVRPTRAYLQQNELWHPWISHEICLAPCMLKRRALLSAVV
jgi:hypothetical protein